MTTSINGTSEIIRTERGLSIDGTRMMLYDVMDFFTLDYPRNAIRDRLLLTDAQIDAALHYIHEHRSEVEAEYQQILQEAEENRRYWEERLREHLARTPEPRRCHRRRLPCAPDFKPGKRSARRSDPILNRP